MPGRLSCRQLSIVFLFLVWAASALPAAPATPTASHTVHYETTRQDEDWSYLRDPARRTDYLDNMKYIPLRNEDGWYMSLGGDVRERYELLDHPQWGQGPTDTNGYWMQRYLLHADIHLGSRVRFFSQFQSGLINGRKGAYFGVIALIGPANHIDLQPSFDLRLIKRWILITKAGFFWRQSIHDGIYGPAINLLRSAGSSTSRFIGSQIATQAEWEINPHFSWTGNYTHFFTGQFLRDTGPSKDVNFFTTWLYYRF